MAIKKVNDASLTSVADAIREKGGTTANLYFPDGFVDAIEAIPTGGDTLAELYIDKTLKTYENEKVFVPQGMFSWSEIENVSFPKCTTINDRAFEQCKNLINADFPLCINIENHSFNGCTAMTSIDFPEVKKINNYGLGNCSKVSTVNLPKLENIYDYSFSHLASGTTTIEEISLPELRQAGNYAFEYVNAEKINFPKLTKYGQYAFRNSSITELTIPATVTSFGYRGIYSMNSLKKLIIEADMSEIPNGFVYYNGYIEEASFLNCSQVPTLASIQHFNVPNTCVIKVPAALEAEWKTATNWANFASQIQGV